MQFDIKKIRQSIDRCEQLQNIYSMKAYSLEIDLLKSGTKPERHESITIKTLQKHAEDYRKHRKDFQEIITAFERHKKS